MTFSFDAIAGLNLIRLGRAPLREIQGLFPDAPRCDSLTALCAWASARFDAPEQRLAAYGTLRPGESHHYLVESAGGSWEPAAVRGHIDRTRRYPRFYWNPEKEPQAVQLLRAKDLDPCWPGIDQWEGPEYIRAIVPAETRHGIELVTLYLGNDAF